MTSALRVLIVEDSEDDAALLLRELRRGGYEPVWERVQSALAMTEALDSQTWDVIIADYAMPQFSAPAALLVLQDSGLDLPFIVVSGTIGEDVAVETMKAGAHDYLMKDNLARLCPAIHRELRDAEVRGARRQAEHDLARRVEELARSNAELEQFAYVASHDLQEPLRMVTSYCDLLQRRYKGRLDADADDFISFAVDGATRMQGLVRDLLAYSRVSIGDQQAEAIDCTAVLSRVLTDLKGTISANKARITHDPLPAIRADRTQLEHLFQNLIGNAIKFHGEKAPEVHIGAESENGHWRFSVADNGIGIDQQYSDKAFAVFQRLHGRGEYAGTGVGLAICKKIVERHGGQIWFESEPGKGSTFYFTLA